uniref:Uncharacterized protein n=1 Tax=Molossus molossus TaxID=27622 RepID=A0A7J8I0Z7_MOLMO|nr:hypothetical protein HJG59_010757 [Molossus molossus]
MQWLSSAGPRSAGAPPSAHHHCLLGARQPVSTRWLLPGRSLLPLPSSEGSETCQRPQLGVSSCGQPLIQFTFPGGPPCWLKACWGLLLFHETVITAELCHGRHTGWLCLRLSQVPVGTSLEVKQFRKQASDKTSVPCCPRAAPSFLENHTLHKKAPFRLPGPHRRSHYETFLP